MNEHPVVTAESIGIKLCKALGLEPDRVQRIVIDIQSGDIGPATIYIQMVGDARLLNISWESFVAESAIKFSGMEPQISRHT